MPPSKVIESVIGGCRSGKSRYALESAASFSTEKKTFVATCLPLDDEMRERVARHQEERGPAWSTIEAPLELPEAILENGASSDVILVDCLTLWISNLLMESETLESVFDHVGRLLKCLDQAPCSIFIVSNEVGTGIVPENRLARLYRDAVGWTNQRVAAQADRVVWMVAGIPVQIK